MHDTPSAAGTTTPAGTGYTLRFVTTNDDARVGTEVPVARPMIIGRDAQTDIVLADPSVSRRHAQVEPAPDGLRLKDLGSGNGVWIGTERVTEVVLRGSDRFRIGATTFECVAPRAAAPVDDDAPTVASALVLRIVEGGENDPAGRTFSIEGLATIGRADDCQVRIAERDVSRRHATVEITPDGVRLTDLGSTGGTWVRGDEVTTAILRAGDSFASADA